MKLSPRVLIEGIRYLVQTEYELNLLYSFYENPRAQFHIEGILLRVLLEFYLIQMRAQLEGGFNERAGSIRRNTVYTLQFSLSILYLRV